MRITLGLCSLATILAVADAAAARPNFNYVGLYYAYQDLEEFDCTQDGPSLEGSLAYDEQIFLQASHVDVTGDNNCGSTTTTFSAGLRGDFGTTSALYGKASFLVRDTGYDSDPGFGLSFGARSLIAYGLEAEAFIGYDSVDENSETYVGGAINYWLTPDFSFRSQLTTTSESSLGLLVGARFNF